MFKNPYVRTIILSNVLLQLGIWVRNFAILLYVTDMTHNDPFSISMISVAEFAPIFLFSALGGTFADRWRPKLTMIMCDFLSAVSIFVVLLILMFGNWHVLFFATLVSAILSQFSQPSAMKLFKQHLPEDQLQGVMAMFQSLMAIFMVIGPMIGTLIYQQYGIFVSIAVMGVMFLLSAIVLLSLPADPKAEKGKKEPSTLMQEMKAGLKYVGASRVLRTLGITFTVAGLAVGLMQPLMMFVAIENLGKDKQFLQWLVTTNGAAMLVGGAIVMGISKKVKPQVLLSFGLLISAIGTVGVGWSTSVGLTLTLQALTGLCFPCIHIGINTLMLKNTEEAFIGRVGGVLTPLFMGMMVIGMALSGPLKRGIELFSVFGVCGVLFLIGALFMVPLFRTQKGLEHQPQS